MVGFASAGHGRDGAPRFPFPALLLDFGLHSARASLVTEDFRALPWTQEIQYAGFRSATDVVAHLIDILSENHPRSLIIAFPGPVLGFRARFTNIDWIVDCMEIWRRFRFENGILLNDQEAAAFSIPDLGTNEIIHIGSRPLPFGAGPEVLISVRHGLGVASLQRYEQKYVSLPSEAGHVGLSPSTPQEGALLLEIIGEIGRLNAEQVFYRPGLELVHRARLRLAGRSAGDADADMIARAAVADLESEEAASAKLFVRLVTNYAGDLALAFFATGGVTLSGPILQKLAPFFQHPSERAAFERRAPMEALMQRVSFRLALIDDLTLRGLTVLAQNPEHFAINFENRCWREAAA
jgi:glucokinase